MRSKLFLLHIHGCSISSSSKRQFGGTLSAESVLGAKKPETWVVLVVGWVGGVYHSGCVGAMSTPMTSADGYSSATSIHQIPKNEV